MIDGSHGMISATCTTSGNGKALRVGVFHPGTQHSWQVALAFQESGQLGWYATSVFYDPARWPYRIERYLPGRLRQRVGAEFRRRYSPLLDQAKVRRFGMHEWMESLTRRLGARSLSYWFNDTGNVAFGRAIIRLIEREPVDVVWGYNTSSLEVFRWAKQRGIRCVLDQTIGHPRVMNRVLGEERERNSEFCLDSYRPYSEALIERQDEEAALADDVVCGCEAQARTIIENGCPASKVRVIPHGYDETRFPDAAPKRPPLRGRPVRCLFAGVLDSRKGAAYLLPAFAQIAPERARLTVMGHPSIPAPTLARYTPHIEFLGQLPRSEVVRHFLDADLFVFPSLFEGSALVLCEAVGAGLGIIQTEAAGNGAIDGVNGIVLKKLSREGLVEAINDATSDVDRLVQWQAASWSLRKNIRWSVARERMRSLVGQ
jgi:glycosyltransferase involved in cell wall biosynthesis